MEKRNTIQKQLVLDAVFRLANHPTAEEVYAEVARSHPTVSKATVYRNLGSLSEDGLLRHIKMPGGADRFDHMLLEHHHIICTRCGCFADAPASGSAALDEAVAQAVRQLRQAYPKSSYNCMIQSQDQLVALCAAGREKTSPRIVEIYDEYGKGEKAHDYRVMRYRDVQDRDGKPSGVVVASSGFEQNESDGWKVLENDQMIVASNRTGEYHVRSI